MLSLNLVSQGLKKEIKLRRIYSLLNSFSFILVIVVVVLAIILSIAKLILENNFNRIVEQTTLITRNSQGYNNKVRIINSKIAAVSQIQGEFSVWSPLLSNLAENVPDGVTFSYLKIDGGKIKIKGIATTRDSLLIFKKNLDKMDSLKNLDFPLQNILKENNIDFEIDADLAN